MILPLTNWVHGRAVDIKSDKLIDVVNPYCNAVIARVPVSSADHVGEAVQSSKKAFEAWRGKTIKARVQVLHTFRHLVEHKYLDELTHLVVREHGKTIGEAKASIMKGMETVEYAASLPSIVQGRVLQVSSGVTCQDTRIPLGVVASVVPFNFPIMVPMWTLPIAIAMGNCMLIKPSEKVPMTMRRIVEILKESGLPDGVVNLVNGDADTVRAICNHKDVKAVTFVGTSKVAEIVSKACRDQNKRCLALGGAKNHLIAAPDCEVDMTARDVVASFSGCSGQRCMAASVLLVVGSQPQLLSAIVAEAKTIRPGCGAGEMGPVIDQASLDKILAYINEAESSGCEILLDGRDWFRAVPMGRKPEGLSSDGGCEGGFWIGPTVIRHKSKDDRAMREEIFGPVLSVYECSTFEEAIAVENSSAYGNAACIYTSSGAVAERATQAFSAGMCGVNIGVPVPREPFSFGGIGLSNFGDADITGDGGVNFFSMRKKITSKWWKPAEKDWLN